MHRGETVTDLWPSKIIPSPYYSYKAPDHRLLDLRNLVSRSYIPENLRSSPLLSHSSTRNLSFFVLFEADAGEHNIVRLVSFEDPSLFSFLSQSFISEFTR